ncbi:MAG: acetate uptake transporter family protein [Saezia sp.]
MNEVKEWANPAPAGLVALAVATFIFFALLTGQVSFGALPLMGCWLIGGFVVQFFVAIVEFKKGLTTGGNVFLFFSAFFMLVGGMEMFVKYFASINGWPLDTTVDGWAWLVLLLILLFYSFAYFKEAPLVMGLLLIFIDIGVFFVTFIDLGILGAGFKWIAGTALLISGLFGIYMSAAIVLNGAYKRVVMPVGSPLIK